MSLRFGTDGVRGRVPEELDVHIAAALGHASAEVLPTNAPCVIGGDTRASTSELIAAFATGYASGGGACTIVGVVPTPAVAFLSRERSCVGAVISASHNPWHDNGIKLFAPGGAKLSDAEQNAVEARFHALLDGQTFGGEMDEPSVDAAAVRSYLDSLIAFGEGRSARSVWLDCGNGASAPFAHEIFERSGVHVQVLHDRPNGRNINADCGSTHPESLIAAVKGSATERTLGFAFDGDADRVLAIDESGEIVDGDGLIALLAVALHRRGELANHAVALTIMSNLGVRVFLASQGIDVVETPVGDRSVAAAMDEHGLVLGGEQSGHIILGQYATTGDGMLSALAILRALDDLGLSLHDFNASIQRYPQVLRNVELPFRGALDEAPAFWSAVEQVRGELGPEGRVVVRASGTEPLMRIMVEAKPGTDADLLAAQLETCAREVTSAHGTA